MARRTGTNGEGCSAEGSHGAGTVIVVTGLTALNRVGVDKGEFPRVRKLRGFLEIMRLPMTRRTIGSVRAAVDVFMAGNAVLRQAEESRLRAGQD